MQFSLKSEIWALSNDSFFLTVLCPANELRLDSTGVILSPGYPDSYPNLQMCAWSISVEKGYNISMFVEFFQTEKEFDVLQVYDGNHRLYLLDIHKFNSNALSIHSGLQYKQLPIWLYFILRMILEVATSNLPIYHMKIALSLIILLWIVAALAMELKCVNKHIMLSYCLWSKLVLDEFHHI